MTEAGEGTLLGEPSEEPKENANVTRHMRRREEVLSFKAHLRG